MRRMKGEGGASLVEFALVLPLLVLLIFGIIDFGFAFNDYQSLRQGVRDGARQGVVSSFGADQTCGLAAPAASANANTKSLICTTKNRAELGDDTRVRIRVLDALDADTTFAKGNRLLVCAQTPLTSVSGVFSALLDDTWLQSKVLMRIEKNTPTVSATQETGVDWAWAWCTA